MDIHRARLAIDSLPATSIAVPCCAITRLSVTMCTLSGARLLPAFAACPLYQSMACTYAISSPTLTVPEFIDPYSNLRERDTRSISTHDQPHPIPQPCPEPSPKSNTSQSRIFNLSRILDRDAALGRLLFRWRFLDRC